MHTVNKDGSKKKFSVSKESRSTKTSATAKDQNTERGHVNQNEESQKIKSKTTKNKSEENEIRKPEKKQSSGTLKSSTKKDEKIPLSMRVSSKQEKKSTKTSSDRENIASMIPKNESVRKEKKSSTNALRYSTKSTQDISKLSKSTSKNIDSSREILLSPSSSRVKKTQYFPSKNLYSNALKSTEIQKKLSELSENKVNKDKEAPKHATKVEKSKKTHLYSKKMDPSVNPKISYTKMTPDKIFSPGSIKSRSVKPKYEDKTMKDSSPDTSSMSERPKTATLRKGSIVNANIVGPEVLKNEKKTCNKEDESEERKVSRTKLKSPSPTSSDDNYEDDFESYESDFETYSSNDDSSDLTRISGEETNALSTSSESIQEKQELRPTMLESAAKSIYSKTVEDEKAHDSGTYELPELKHKQILENIKESLQKEANDKVSHASFSDEGFEELKSLQFINFVDAQRRYERQKMYEMMKKRGEQILSMIKLDNVTYTIFYLPSVPYDEFISKYGQTDTMQTAVQTGHDDISEEVQTEALEIRTKWTQMPVQLSSFDQNKDNFWENYKKEFLGVGDDADESTANKPTNIINNQHERRLKLFLNHSVDLVCDILAEANIRNIDKLKMSDQDLPFSDGYLELNTQNDIFKNTRVENISVFSRNINKILVVHIKNCESDDLVKSLVTLWNLSDYTTPRITLISYGEVSCSTFSSDYLEYIFAGQKDGAILMWSIRNKSAMYGVESESPCFMTDIGSGHFTKVVSIKPITNRKDNRGFFDEPETVEVCSLDEEGVLMFWEVYTDPELSNTMNKTILINTMSVNFQDRYPECPDLLCSDFILVEKHIYVSTNYGCILHHIILGSRRDVRKFIPASTIEATTLESCPFSSSYFLAGYLDGTLQIYNTRSERSLMVLRNSDEITYSRVQIIEWSKTKPFILYVKDSRNTLHIWDLSKSDFSPLYSITFTEKISFIKLSPVIDIEQEETSYMLIGTEEGKVYLHVLNKEYGQASHKNLNDQVETFLNYANRL